ncbi:DUF4468 domain-containing protein [Dyadobacter sp. CY356]|uniref:DUF4468 domain-containing protein n=1 Tax=Dyadobacter sp. CY356 TaxID=2906442 RepID=UPI001F1CCA32|nr:DUF4468 domain-containing protein [Dyadobacter sp. CY356]MCF0058637.1 DUF4468 domain-containing protein [Dyadobacter sp. CY356]
MKKVQLLLLILSLVSFRSFGQDGYLPVDNQKKVVYTDVASLEKTKDVLYQNAQKWVVKTFGNYQNVVVSENKQSGKLVLNSYTPVSTPSFEYLRYTLIVDCEDNKYHVTINEVEGISKSQTVTSIGKKQNDEILEKEILLKTESGRKKKSIAEEALKQAKVDNDQINQAMYGLLASLKLAMSADGDL